MWVRIAAPTIGGYLLGSIPTAVIIGRRRHVDLRAVGDRNPGWWNAKEELGRRAALPVLVGDVAKGAAGAAIGRAIARPGEWWLGYVGGATAMLGHAWPLFARFRGGRSVATLGGAAGVLSPAAAALAVGTGVAVGRAVGSSASGIRAGFGAYPVAQVVIDGPVRTAATGGLMSIVGLRFWLAARRA
jgi:glycerol-3-phosphate acyltransferase PlsY